jgi:HEAT repeat protein
VFALVRSSTNELLFFEFGEPLDPYLPLEEHLRRILADFDGRRAEFTSLSVTQSIGLLLDWLDEAGDDAGRLLPLIRALGFLRSPNSAPALERYLSHPSRDVRRETIVALGRIGELESLPKLEPFLQSPEPDLRRAAIVALSKSLDPATFPMLEAAAGLNPELQELVRQGRRRMEAIEAKDLQAFTDAVIETEEYEDLLGMLDLTGQYVIDILDDRRRDLTVRRRALELVGLAGLKKAGAPLAAVLAEERDPFDIMIQAAVAAGRCKARQAVEPLIALLDHGQPLLQEAAITSLGQIGSPLALDPLLAKWNDGAPELRDRIRLALRRLCKVPGADTLAELLRTNADWQPAAVYFIDASLRLSTSYSEGLLDNELNDARVEARRDAILLLAYLGSSREATKLEPMLREGEDPAIRNLAALAQARMTRGQ